VELEVAVRFFELDTNLEVLCLDKILVSEREGADEELSSGDGTEDLAMRRELSWWHDGESLLEEFESMLRVAPEEGEVALVEEHGAEEASRGVLLDIEGGREGEGSVHLADMARQVEEIVAHVEVTEPVEGCGKRGEQGEGRGRREMGGGLLELQDTHLCDEVAQVSGRNETADGVDGLDELLPLQISRGDEVWTKVNLLEESPHEDVMI
jgi:hypothetical protein